MKADSKTIAALIAEFRKPGQKYAYAAMRELVRMGALALPALLDAAQTGTNTDVRRWAIDTLGAWPRPAVKRVVIAALGDGHMSIRLHGIFAVERMGDRRLARHLTPLIADTSGGVRVNAVAAVGRMGHVAAVKAVQRAAQDEKWYVRQAAAQALGAIGGRGSLPVLRELLKDSRKAVREAAMTAVRNITGKKAQKKSEVLSLDRIQEPWRPAVYFLVFLPGWVAGLVRSWGCNNSQVLPKGSLKAMTSP